MAKPHSLVRIKGTLVNTPHLIEQNSFNSILEYVNSRIEGNASLATPELATWDDTDGDYSGRYVDAVKLGVMEISGPLTYRTSGWEAMCGGTSYEMLKEQMDYFASQGAKTVAMYVDSGGGEAHGMIDSANYIRKVADEHGIKIIAYVDGMSASAAYGISCIADEIVMSSDSQVGSIGVLIQLYNDSKYLEKIGYERTFITAGEDKVPFDNEGAFTESFLNGLQEQVDHLYEKFTTHVAGHRSLDLSAVKGTEANVFMSHEAVPLGLADSVMTAEEFNDYISSQAVQQTQGNNVSNPLKKLMSKTNQEDTEMSQVAELTDLLAKANAQLETQSAAAQASADAVASLTSQVATLTSQLEANKEALAAIETAKAEAALASRKAALSEVMPADQVETKLASYAQLDDATFAFMVGELQTAKDSRAASFKAIGEDGVEQEDEVEEATVTHASLLEAGKAAARALHR